ncbi:MAG: CmcJ/NvfI family oxidoreductase [Pseudomonadota bacterium]
MMTTGEFHFMTPDTEASLYRNGKVLMHRDARGSTAGSQGVTLTGHSLSVADARKVAIPPTCETNGFELVQRPVEQPVDFLDHQNVVQSYYPQCAALVAEKTGGLAFAFDHNIRSASGKADGAAVKGGQEVQGPAHVVHGDYTLRSAPDRLGQLAQPPSGNDTLRNHLPVGSSLLSTADIRAAETGRFAIINVWRNIDTAPVATHPLAFCDAQTVQPEDLVVFEIHYADRVGENYFAKFAVQQRLYYFPALTRDEAVLIKQWDSAGPLARSGGALSDATDPAAPCTFSFHSAFEPERQHPDAPDRWSVEVRCVVIYG